jgi:hypothetical protein
MAQGDIFISYASEDKEWAEKLEQSLIAKQKSVFRDKSRLSAGRPFEDQLLDALDECAHMVALWSPNARNSDWVTKEMSVFDVKFRKEKKKTLIIIVLDDDPKAFASLEMIYEIKVADAYKGGATNIGQKVWDKVIERTLAGLNSNQMGPQEPIKRLFLTLTKADLPKLDYTAVVYPNVTLQTIIDDAALNNELPKLYGDTRMDWRTFDDDRHLSMSKMTDRLDKILVNINNVFKTNFGWQDVPETIFDTASPEQEPQIALLAVNPSVIIIDPIALHHPKINQLFGRLEACFENRNCVIVTYSLTDHSAMFHLIRRSIEVSAFRFHRSYFNPPIPRGNVLAQISANPNDEIDIKRRVQMLIGDIRSGGKSSSVTFTSY